MGWLSFFGGLINTGGNVAVSILGNNARQQQAEAAAAQAQAELEKAKQNEKLYLVLILAAVACVIFLIIKKSK